MLRLVDGYVSGQHALVRWTGMGWGVTDLRSRNGTFVDGRRLDPLEERALRRGTVVAFGRARQQEWQLEDPSPPEPTIVPVDGGDAVSLSRGLAALPSTEDLQATVFRDVDGAWILERRGEVTSEMTDGEVFLVGGRAWQLCVATRGLGATLRARTPMEMARLRLVFSPTKDGRAIHLHVAHAGGGIDFGDEISHSDLLLELARRRLADRDGGMTDAKSGWVREEDLSVPPGRAPRSAEELDREIFRIRSQFAAFGAVDAANVVERWPRTRQLRVGTAHLSITSPTCVDAT